MSGFKQEVPAALENPYAAVPGSRMGFGSGRAGRQAARSATVEKGGKRTRIPPGAPTAWT